MMTSPHPIRIRHSARLILLDQENRILLLEFDDPNVVDPRYTTSRFWCTPGGGLEDGESIEEAARRELGEETGITDALIGHHVATLSADLQIRGEPMRFVNHFVVARCVGTALSFASMEDYESSFFLGYRWWSYEELVAESADLRPRETLEMIREAIGK